MPPFQPYKCIIAGYTGFVGSELTRHLLRSPLCHQLLAVGRNAVEPSLQESFSKLGPSCYSKLEAHVIEFDQLATLDFSKESPNAASKGRVSSNSTDSVAELPISVAYCTLGPRHTTFAKEIEQVDHDYTIAFAQFCKSIGVKHMTLLSGLTAHHQSYITQSQVKGKAIRALEEMGFERLSVFKPSLVVSKAPTTISKRITQWIHPIVSEFLPISWRYVFVEDLAKAMILNGETCEGDSIEHLTFVDFMSLIGKTPPESTRLTWKS